MMKYRAFRSTIAESFCKSLPIQHASVKERFQYYKRQDICLLFILVLYDTIDRYIFNLKAGKKMKCATWANGRRATHEQRKQKDLNELPPQFTQIFSFQYTQTLRSLSVTCKDAEKKRKLWINNFRETLSIMQRCAAILFSRLMKNQQCIPAREKLAAQSAPLAWPASLLRSTTCSVLTSLAWEQKRCAHSLEYEFLSLVLVLLC